MKFLHAIALVLSVAVCAATIPKPGDVCFTSRSVHSKPIGNNNSHPWLDTMEAAAAFHATRMDWIYTTDVAFFKESNKRGWPATAAINAMVPDNYTGPATYQIGRIEDLYGNKLTAPWMREWKVSPYYGCVNNPDYLSILFDRTARLIHSGVSGIQHDDPHTNAEAVSWKHGGCYCNHCMKKFGVYAAKRGLVHDASFNYKAYLVQEGGYGHGNSSLREAFEAFQFESAANYTSSLRSFVRSVSENVSLSCNNGGHVWDEVTKHFDFGMGELTHDLCTPDQLRFLFLHPSQGGRLPTGKKQVVTMPKTSSIDTADKILTRKGIAFSSALGGHMMVPWDIYLPTPNAMRFYANVSDFEDLYLMIRDNAQVLDEYNSVAHTWSSGPAVLTIFGASPAADVMFVIKTATEASRREGQIGFMIHLIDWKWGNANPRYPLPTTPPNTGAFTVSVNLTAVSASSGHSSLVNVSLLQVGGLQKPVNATITQANELLFSAVEGLAPWAIYLVSFQ